MSSEKFDIMDYYRTTEFLDITQEFFQETAKLPLNSVAKDEGFSLFSGTHALEIGIPQLDTSLIKLSAEEENFDTSAPLDVVGVLSVTDKLFRLLFIWIDNSHPLSSTVFSCRYMEKLVADYEGDKDFESATFLQNKAMQQTLKQRMADFDAVAGDNSPAMVQSQNFILTHQVMRSLFLGITIYVAHVQKSVQKGHLYEEEDIITQMPDFNMLNDVDEFQIVQQLVISTIWIMKKFRPQSETESEAKTLLVHFLNLMRSLVESLKISSKPVPAFNINDPVIESSFGSASSQSTIKTINLSFLDKILASLNAIKSSELMSNLPEPKSGTFSYGFQKRNDNIRPLNHLPDVNCISYETLYKLHFSDMRNKLVKFNQLYGKTLVDVKRYLKMVFHSTFRFNNIVFRAFFMNFFFNEQTNSLAGSEFLPSTNLMLGDMAYNSLMLDLNCINLVFGDPKFIIYSGSGYYSQPMNLYKVMDPVQILFQFKLSGLSSEQAEKMQEDNDHKVKIRDQMQQIIVKLEELQFKQLCNVANNPSRQRQCISNLVFLFDSAQVTAESFDYKLYDNYGFNDGVGPSSKSPILPFSSFIHLNKMKAMVAYLLLGTSLNIYKTWEFVYVYWYSAYLCNCVLEELVRNERILLSKFERLNRITFNKSQSIQQNFASTIEIFENDAMFSYHLKAGISEYSKNTARFAQRFEEIKQQKLAIYKSVFESLQSEKKFWSVITRMCNCTYTLLHYVKILQLLSEPKFDGISSMIKKYNSKPSTSFKEMLYKLRMKSFSNVGIPEMLTYEQFNNSSKEMGTFVLQEKASTVMKFAKFSQSFKELSKEINDVVGDLQKLQKSVEVSDEQMHELKDSGKQLAVFMGQLQDKVSAVGAKYGNKEKLKYSLVLKEFEKAEVKVDTDVGHRYFPRFLLESDNKSTAEKEDGQAAAK